MRNLNDLWSQAVTAFPNRPAVIHSGRAYTYCELDELIQAFGSNLRERLAVKPGDRLALMMPNCLHSIICYLGGVRVGAIAVPINVRLRAEEMRFVLEDSGARTAVVHRSVWATVAEAVQDLASLEALIGVELAAEGVTPVETLLEPARCSPPCAGLPDDVAAIIYTSGTTGRPKGAMLTHGNVLFNMEATIHGHGFRPEDIHILAVPLFHVTGLNTVMSTAFHQGATVVVTAGVAPTEILELIQRHRATTWFGVPTTMILLAQVPDVRKCDLSSLRLIAYSGAPMPVRTIEQLRRLFPGVKLHNFFGLTETTSCTSVLPDDQALIRPESIGLPVPGLEAKVVDDEGRDLPAGQVGELLIKGPSVFQGYHNRPEATAEAIVDGWFHTGDTATIEEEGFIFLQGRKKEMIIVGGENVYPVEVENVLTRHPAVAEAAVIGVPQSVFGEVVKAVVVLRPGTEAGPWELKRYCAKRLASFKVPQVIEFRDALPRNPSGKVVKRELR